MITRQDGSVLRYDYKVKVGDKKTGVARTIFRAASAGELKAAIGNGGRFYVVGRCSFAQTFAV